MTNAQLEQEVEAGHTFRFKFPVEAYREIFNASGKGLIYVSGGGEHKWVFSVIVAWSVPDTLRRTRSDRDA